MIILEANLEIRVSSRIAAESLLADEPQRWCAISIRGPQESKANLSRAKDSAIVVFDDVSNKNDMFCPRLAHAQAIIEAAGKFAGNPLLIHCAMGLSRSPAAALGILYFHAKKQCLPDPVDFSMNWLNQLGDFKPNPLLAKLMIGAIEPTNPKFFERFRKHPLWKAQPSEDLSSRLLPKPKRPQ